MSPLGPADGKVALKIVPPRPRIPCWKGRCADSGEKHEPASNIDAATVDSLKALDPSRPIREADSCTAAKILSFALCPAQRPGGFDAVFQLSACVYRPFPRPIRQNIVVVEFLRLAAMEAVATTGGR